MIYQELLQREIVIQPDIFQREITILASCFCAQCEIREASKAAMEWINRATGQLVRRMKERVAE